MRYLPFFLLLASSCTPLKNSPSDHLHQFELVVHEVQTKLDDVKHDLSSFDSEIQILDGRMKAVESSTSNTKEREMERYRLELAKIGEEIPALFKKMSKLEGLVNEELATLTRHANETTEALLQAKARILEIEEKLYQPKEAPPTYTVRPGDTLEKIAKAHGTTVEKIQKLNHLDTDRIRIGHELVLPR